MGTIKKFAQYLSDGSFGKKNKGEDPLRKTIIQLKIFGKRLRRQIKKMEMEQKRAHKKAVERRKAGDIEGSRLHMKSSLQFRKWSHAIETFRVRLDGVQFKLEQAKAVGDFTGVAQDIVGILGELQMNIKSPQITKMLSQLDFGFGRMDAMFNEVSEQLEMSEDSSSTAVNDAEVDEALAEVDAELSIGTRESLPSVPGAVGESDITDLEAEIKRLKSQRD